MKAYSGKVSQKRWSRLHPALTHSRWVVERRLPKDTKSCGMMKATNGYKGKMKATLRIRNDWRETISCFMRKPGLYRQLSIENSYWIFRKFFVQTEKLSGLLATNRPLSFSALPWKLWSSPTTLETSELRTIGWEPLMLLSLCTCCFVHPKK